MMIVFCRDPLEPGRPDRAFGAEVAAEDLERVDCPKGWMSPEGYARYLDSTPAKMKEPGR